MTEVRENMKNKYDTYTCVACENKNIFVKETQEHIVMCDTLSENEPKQSIIFSDIYSHKTENIKQIVNIFSNNMTKREKYLQKT